MLRLGEDSRGGRPPCMRYVTLQRSAGARGQGDVNGAAGPLVSWRQRRVLRARFALFPDIRDAQSPPVNSACLSVRAHVRSASTGQAKSTAGRVGAPPYARHSPTGKTSPAWPGAAWANQPLGWGTPASGDQREAGVGYHHRRATGVAGSVASSVRFFLAAGLLLKRKVSTRAAHISQ